MSGVATGARAKACMDAAWELLGSKRGLLICAPPYTGFPNPSDPLVGNAPGTGENGAIFCHANTWAVIAYAMLGDAERAYTVFRQVWPGLCAEEQGQDHWGKEPYVFNSTINGPARGADFGKAGISWLTGTATWMQVALTQHLLGVRPERDRLAVSPCLPESLGEVRVVRRLRGQEHRLRLRGSTVVEHTVA
jgi:cellobiose phosphorylase